MPSEEGRATAICNMLKIFGEDWTCSSEDMIVDRETHTHTHTRTHAHAHAHAHTQTDRQTDRQTQARSSQYSASRSGAGRAVPD